MLERGESMNLRNRFYLAFASFVLLPLIVLGWMSYEVSSKILKDQISQHMLDTIGAIDLNIESILGEVNLFTDYVITSETVQRYVSTTEWLLTSDKTITENTITRLLFSYPYTHDFLMLDKNGDPFYFISLPKIPLHELEEMAYFQEIKNRQGAPYWIGPVENQDLSKEDLSYFTIGRSILNPHTLETMGYLFLHIQPDVLSKANRLAKNSDSEWMILNEQGSIIYSSGSELIEEDLSAYTKGDSAGQVGSIIHKRSDGTEFLLAHSPTVNDWTLVSVKSWESVNAQIAPIRTITIFLVVGLLLLFMFFHRVFSQRLLTFFSILKGTMDQTADGDLHVEMPRFKEPEFDTLANGFNDMVGKLKVMIQLVEEEQKKKQRAEFKVLQHQINPHFLYNTLESVNALASLNKTEEVQRLITNLGKLLRISLKGPYDITFEEELRHVTSYLEIQKIRHNHRFRYESKIEEQVKDVPILKLILQPIVENSIEHGIWHDTFDLITIQAEQHQDRLIIDVCDNGPGFDENSRLNLNKQEMNHQGHGILNVHERLRMYYGNKGGLIICSSEFGSTVRITIPIPMNKGDA